MIFRKKKEKDVKENKENDKLTTMDELERLNPNGLPKLIKLMGLTKKEGNECINMCTEISEIKYPRKSDKIKHITKSKLNEKQKVVIAYLLGEFSGMKNLAIFSKIIK